MPTTYVSRISQWIEKRYNAKGGNVITDVDPSAVVIVPVLIGVEERYGQGWNRFIGSTSVAPVAAQFSRTQLLNPAGSNMIAVVESLTLIGTATSGVDWTIANGQADLATVQAPGTLLRRLDFRSGFTDAVAHVSFDNSATQFPGAANVIMRRANSNSGAPDEVIRHQDQEITILPKDSLWLVSDVVNSTLQVNLMWRERALELSELT